MSGWRPYLDYCESKKLLVGYILVGLLTFLGVLAPGTYRFLTSKSKGLEKLPPIFVKEICEIMKYYEIYLACIPLKKTYSPVKKFTRALSHLDRSAIT